MATFYKDPVTGERIRVDVPHAPVRSSAGLITFIVLVAFLIVGSTVLNHYVNLWSNEASAQATLNQAP